MAINFADGFDEWAYATYAQEGYTLVGANTAPSTVTGRRSGSTAIQYARPAGGGAQWRGLTRSIDASVSTIHAHMAVNNVARPSLYTHGLFEFREGSTVHISLGINTSGQIVAYRGPVTGGTLLGTGTGLALTAGTWYSIEVKVVIHDSTGSVEVRAGGSVITGLNLSGIDTRNAGTGVCNTIGLFESVSPGTTSNSGTIAIDDLVVFDTTGSICNTWTGDIRVDSSLPTGAGDSTQFTPSAGSNFQCVDDATSNTTDYVDSSTAGHIDLYAMGNLSHTPTNIYGVYATALSTKDDAGSRSLKLKTKSGATTSDSASLALTSGSWVRLTALFETDPNTSAAWTKSGWDAAQAGIECV